MRTFFQNQEGVGACATIVVLLALAWIPALLLVRETFPFALHAAFGGSLGSWLLLRWCLKRPGANNFLISSLKEIKTFFGILSVCCALFFAVYLWRFGTGDPIKTSQTLLQIEQMRDRIRGAPFFTFLSEPGWKFGLAAIGFLALFLPANALRRILRGVSRRAPPIVRYSLYVLTVLSAFTFGGSLSDGVLSRVEPVLNARSNEITEGFAQLTKSELPKTLDAIVDELIHSPPSDRPQQDHSAPTIYVPDPAPAASTAHPLSPVPPVPSGPDGSDPTTGPQRPQGPDDRPRGPSPALQLARSWNGAFNTDLHSADEHFRGPPFNPRVFSDRISPPSSASVSQIVSVANRPSPPQTDASASDATEEELRSVIHAGLEAALDEHISLTGLMHKAGIDFVESDPFREQLKAVSDQLIDGPFKDAVYDLASSVMGAILKNAALDTRAWIRERMSQAKADSPFSRTRQAISSLRQRVAGTYRGLLSSTDHSNQYLVDAFAATDLGYKTEWETATHNMGRAARVMAMKKYDSIHSKQLELSPLDRAEVQTAQLERIIAMPYRQADALRDIERTVLGSDDIRTAMEEDDRRAQVAERALAERREREDRDRSRQTGGGGADLDPLARAVQAAADAVRSAGSTRSTAGAHPHWATGTQADDPVGQCVTKVNGQVVSVTETRQSQCH